MEDEFKVGELARKTGVSVRTLHWYEECGLLGSVRRTAAGHRRFGRAEVMRLQAIRSLVQLGFSLDEVKGFLGDPDFSFEVVVELHLTKLDETIARQQGLRRRLAAIARRLQAAEEIAVEDILGIIKEMAMFDKQYTPGQLTKLEAQRAALGPEAIEQAQSEWAELIAEVQAQMDQGATATSRPVLELARRWQALIDAFAERDPATTQSLAKVWQHEGPRLRKEHGRFVPSAAMMQYMSGALRALHGDSPASSG